MSRGRPATMADALPGLGIVAAVLGVVITMGALGGPKEDIGEKVAAAWWVLSLGILLCYGVFGPLASAMAKQNDAEGLLRLSAHGGLGVIKGLSPMMAVELARRAIPSTSAALLQGNGNGLPRRRQGQRREAVKAAT